MKKWLIVGILVFVVAIVIAAGSLVWLLGPGLPLPFLRPPISTPPQGDGADHQATPTASPTPEYFLILPPGWSLDRDSKSQNHRELLLRSQETWATVLVVNAAKPEEYISYITRRYAYLLELSGFQTTQRSGTLKNGYTGHIMEAEGQGQKVEQQVWLCPQSDRVYVVTLNATPESFPKSQEIFTSLACR